jgi:hypothetical protein
VYDATDLVTGRLLGVPRPASAPTATVNVNDEFTTEERTASIQAAQTYMRNIVAVAMQPLFRGSPSDDPVDYRPGLTPTAGSIATTSRGWIRKRRSNCASSDSAPRAARTTGR